MQKIKKHFYRISKRFGFMFFFPALGSFVVAWDKDGNNSDNVGDVQTLETFLLLNYGQKSQNSSNFQLLLENHQSILFI